MSKREQSVTRARAYLQHLFTSRGQAIPELPPCCLIAHSDALVAAARLRFAGSTFDLGSRRSCEVHVLRAPAGSFAITAASAGAPMSALLVEELHALGARAFVSVGPAGHLSNSHGRPLAPGDIVAVDEALVCEGTSRYYGSEEGNERPHAALNTTLMEALARHRVPFCGARTVSTDALYRETPSFLRQVIARGATVIDMEASALFSSCRFYGLASAALLIVSDSVRPGATWSLAMADDRIARAEQALLPVLCELAGALE